MATRVARLRKLIGMLATSGHRGIRRQYTMARRIGRRSWCAVGEATLRAARHATTLASATASTHGQAVVAAAASRGPARSHQAGAYRQMSQPAATMITGQAASTSRLIATNA